MRYLARWLIAAQLLLSGCAMFSATPTPGPVEKVMVSVPCLEAMPAKPALRTDAELMALDRGRRTLAMWEDRRKREGYEARVEAVLEACRR